MKRILIILLLAVVAFPAFAQMGAPIIIPIWPFRLLVLRMMRSRSHFCDVAIRKDYLCICALRDNDIHSP